MSWRHLLAFANIWNQCIWPKWIKEDFVFKSEELNVVFLKKLDVIDDQLGKFIWFSIFKQALDSFCNLECLVLVKFESELLSIV